MKRVFIVVLILVIIFIGGCNKADVKPPETEEEASTVEDMPEVPDEWKGKTIKDILDDPDVNIVSELDTPTDTTDENTTDSNETEEVAEPLPSGTHLVELQMYNDLMQFFPDRIVINKGDTVRWINKLDYHDRQAKVRVQARHDLLFVSPMLAYGEYFEFTFEESGEYLYGAVPYESYFKTGTVVVV